MALSNGGLNVPLTLASQGYNSGTTSQTLQLSDTQTRGTRFAAESRFQYQRIRLQRGPVSTATTLLVEGAFNGGGDPAQRLVDHQDHFEFEQRLSFDRGAHYLRMAGRYRLQREASFSTANYNGQLVYSNTTAGGAVIPALTNFSNNNPSQYTITTGQPGASLLTGDLAAYVEDEWKVASNVTLDLGFRLENQSAIPDHLDPAPRAGISWALHRRGQKSPTAVLRGGGGLFYDRFPAADLLTAVRQNGVSQQTYTYAFSGTSPCTPVPACLPLTAAPPTVYRVSPNLRAESGWIGGVTVQKLLGRFGTVSANYQAIRGVHQWGVHQRECSAARHL